MALRSQVTNFNEIAENQMGYSACVNDGQLLHLAGVIAVDSEMNIVGPGDMKEQIRRVYEVISVILEKNGASFSNIVNEVIFSTDLSLLADPDIAAVRTQCYESCAAPASTAVQVSGLILPDALIEIQVTASIRA